MRMCILQNDYSLVLAQVVSAYLLSSQFWFDSQHHQNLLEHILICKTYV